jgi:hypothetical protein
MGVVHTTEPMTASTAAAETITLEIPADLAWVLKGACVDSASHWHHLWQDAADGKRTDLSADGARSLSRKAWALWELLDSQGV